MGATQQCPDCGSPLRPCKCDRTKKKRPKRRPAARERDRFEYHYHSGERVEWVGRLVCCACRRVPAIAASENHHCWAEGMGRKGPYQAIVPLCLECHRRYHRIGKLSMLQASAPLTIARPSRGHYRMVAIALCDSWEEAAAEVEKAWRQSGVGR